MATGPGLYFALRQACADKSQMQKLGLPPGIEGKRLVVHGLGNVGYDVAKFCREAGAAIVAIAEQESAIFDAKAQPARSETPVRAAAERRLPGRGRSG